MYRRFLTAGAAQKKQPKRKQKVRLQKRKKVHQKKTGKHRLTRRVPDRKKRQSRAPEAAKQ